MGRELEGCAKKKINRNTKLGSEQRKLLLGD